MNELELIPTKELIAELLRRCDIGVIIMNQDRTADEAAFILSHRGPMLAVLGLAELGKTRLIDYHKEGIHDSEMTYVPVYVGERAEDEDDMREMDEDEEFDFIDDPTELEDEDDDLDPDNEDHNTRGY